MKAEKAESCLGRPRDEWGRWVLRGYQDAAAGRPFARAPRGRGHGRSRGGDPRWAYYMEGLRYGTLRNRR